MLDPFLKKDQVILMTTMTNVEYSGAKGPC